MLGSKRSTAPVSIFNRLDPCLCHLLHLSPSSIVSTPVFVIYCTCLHLQSSRPLSLSSTAPVSIFSRLDPCLGHLLHLSPSSVVSTLVLVIYCTCLHLQSSRPLSCHWDKMVGNKRVRSATRNSSSL